MIIIEIIVFIFWAVLGFLFWLPLLFRVIAGFCGSLLYNMAVNNPDGIRDSKVSLDLAISFYAKGFQTIHSSLYENQNETRAIRNNEFHLTSFFGQILWTLLFWGLTFSPIVKPNILRYIDI